MNQNNAVLGLLVFVVAAFGGLVFYDIKYGHKFEKRFGGPAGQTQNWKWDDNWSGKGQPVAPPKAVTPPAPTVPPATPAPSPGQQLIAGSYQEGINKSGETGKPVLAFFTSDSCSWCVKMKSDTMTDSRVQAVLRNYILVYVDTDRDREAIRKFGVRALPSFVVTNHREERLKMDMGYKNADSFSSWLNDPGLFTQPRRAGN